MAAEIEFCSVGRLKQFLLKFSHDSFSINCVSFGLLNFESIQIRSKKVGLQTVRVRIIFVVDAVIRTGIGLGLMYLPAVVMVGFYFERHRALASGVSCAGSGIGMLALAPLAAYLLDAYDWRNTLAFVAGVALQCVVAGALLRPLPLRVQLAADDDDDDGGGDVTSLLKDDDVVACNVIAHDAAASARATSTDGREDVRNGYCPTSNDYVTTQYSCSLPNNEISPLSSTTLRHTDHHMYLQQQDQHGCYSSINGSNPSMTSSLPAVARNFPLRCQAAIMARKTQNHRTVSESDKQAHFCGVAGNSRTKYHSSYEVRDQKRRKMHFYGAGASKRLPRSKQRQIYSPFLLRKDLFYSGSLSHLHTSSATSAASGHLQRHHHHGAATKPPPSHTSCLSINHDVIGDVIPEEEPAIVIDKSAHFEPTAAADNVDDVHDSPARASKNVVRRQKREFSEYLIIFHV